MKKIALAGKYTPEAVEAFRTALADEDCEIAVVNTPEAYAALTDADAMVLRVFKAYKADIERMPDLKLICRWGVGVDSVDVPFASSR
ncbi:MAG: hypothetical protein IJ233_08705, partial [Pyramidobacter sp.]|nr:hypothetical protein [Pyramidobacter sp.]